jgi:voltage-gated potassium channel
MIRQEITLNISERNKSEVFYSKVKRISSTTKFLSNKKVPPLIQGRNKKNERPSLLTRVPSTSTASGFNSLKVNKSNINPNKKPYNIEYLTQLMENGKKEKMRIIYRKKCKIYTEIIYYIFSCILSIFSVFIFIILSNATTNNELIVFYRIDFAITNVFLFEFLVLLMLAKSKLSYFYSIHPWVDIITTCSGYFSAFTPYLGVKFGFIRILKILRITNILQLYNYLGSINEEKNIYELQQHVGRSNTRIRKILFQLLMRTISLIFISAGFCTLISFYDNQAFSLGYLKFQDSFYFMIVSLTSIGYGDITPTVVYTRLMMVALIMVLLYYISDIIAEIASVLRSQNESLSTFKESGHIIVFGNIYFKKTGKSPVLNFLNQLYQEIREKEKDEEKIPPTIVITLTEDKDEISDIKNYNILEYPNLRRKVFYTTVMNIDADTFARANFQEASAIFCINNGHLNYCKNNSDKLISYYLKKLESINFEMLMIKKYKKINIKDIQNPKKIFVQYLIHEENLNYLAGKDLFAQTCVPRMKLITNLITKSIFCKGFPTLMTNLFKKNKLIIDKTILTQNYYFNYYLRSLNQSLRVEKLPECLIGESFISAVKILYVGSVEYIRRIQKIDNNEQDTEEDMELRKNYSEERRSMISVVLLIGLLTCKPVSNDKGSNNYCNYKLSTLTVKRDQTKQNKRKLKKKKSRQLNGVNYMDEQLGLLIDNIRFNPDDDVKIGGLDFGIYCANDFIRFDQFFEFIESNIIDLKENIIPKFFNHDRGIQINSNQISKCGEPLSQIINVENFEQRDILMSEDMCSNKEKEKELIKNRLRPKKSQKEEISKNYPLQIQHQEPSSSILSNSKGTDNIVKRYKLLNKHFSKFCMKERSFLDYKYKKLASLNENKRYRQTSFQGCPKQNLRNHIIIIGWNDYIEDLVSSIRMHSLSKTVVVVSTEIENSNRKCLLKKFTNLYLIKGDPLSLVILNNINTRFAYFVVIMPSRHTKTENLDANSVLAARLIEQEFKIPYIIELQDELNTNFLGNLPILNYSPMLDNEENNFSNEIIFPNFMEGKIFFSTIFDKMLARAYTKNYQAACFKAFLELDFKNNQQKISNICRMNKELQEEFECLGSEKLNIEQKLYEESEITIFSVPLTSKYEGKMYSELLIELLLCNTIPIAIYNKKLIKIDNSVDTECLEENEMLLFPGLSIDPKKKNKVVEKNQKMKNFLHTLRSKWPHVVKEYVQLEESTAPLLITNPSPEMILNCKMEVIVIGKFNKKIIEQNENILQRKNSFRLSKSKKKEKHSLTTFMKKVNEKKVRSGKIYELKKLVKELDKRLDNLEETSEDLLSDN